MVKVVHCKREAYDIYIGRPSIWGNPFSHLPTSAAEFRVKDRKEAVSRYKEWLLMNKKLLEKLPELRGKVLGCWCKPVNGFNGQLLCHGQILAALCLEVDIDQYLERFCS